MISTYSYYFLILRRTYNHIENNEEVQISMNDLVNLFFCTHRNVKIILNKLSEEKLILFKPGRGRGNISSVIFLESFNKYLRKKTELLIKENEISKALELVKEFGKESGVEDYLIKWISHYFGYQKISHSNEDLDVLRFPIYRPITTIDPAKVFFDFDAHLIMQIFNTLVKYDAKTDSLVGSLSHAWESDEQGQNWLFFLRKGIKFHNGKELTASDVKKSILRLKKSPHKWLVDDVLDIEEKSKYSILFILNKTNHLFLHFLSFTPMSIVDTSHKYDGFAEYPVGTGPFQIEKIQEDLCILTAFGTYFQTRPHLDRVEIIKISDYFKDDWQRLFLDAGESEKHKINLEESVKKFSGTNVLTFNMKKKGPLQNENLRQLFNNMINRVELLKIGKPRLSVANGFRLNNQKLEKIGQNTYPSIDLNANCKKLLRNAGYKGEKLILTTYQRHAKDAACIQQNLLEFGVHLTVNIVDWAYIQREEILNESDMILFEGTPNEGIISLFDLFFYEKGFIYPFLTVELKKELDKYANILKAENNHSARLKKSLKLEKLLIEKGLIIFLLHKIVDVTYDSSLEGVTINSRMWVDFGGLWYRNIRI